MLEKYSILGIYIDQKVLETITEEGVYIYAGSKRIAVVLRKWVAYFPKLWKEGSLINIFNKDIIKVLLVDS